MLLALSDPAAQDPAVAGEKAARLSHASAAGLPVLAGHVLPVGSSGTAIAAGARALVGSGPSAAYLAASETPTPLVEEAAASLLPDDGSLIVRSSTALDGDGRWSGAFTSYVDVQRADVPAAIRGCWASAFTRDVLSRCEEMGVRVDELRIGVLFQPFIRFDAGGTTRIRPDGTVLVTASRDGPGATVAGRDGLDVAVGPDGRCAGPVVGPITSTMVRAAAALARRVADATGIGTTEWGAAGDDLLLLQVGPATPVPTAELPLPRGPAALPVEAERLAGLVTRYPGQLGEALVLPWALGAAEIAYPGAIDVADPRAALREAGALADRLGAGVWGLPPADARARTGSLLRGLRRGRTGEAVRMIRELSSPDPVLATRVVHLVEGVGSALARRGSLTSGRLVWRLTQDQLRLALAGGSPIVPRGPDGWGSFVAEVVRARGPARTGTPVAGGVGAGPLHVVRRLREAAPSDRGVLAVARPLPQLSPLLWHAAGLVTGGGGTGAHLFEVARSLGVPTVSGVDLSDLEDLDAGDRIAAVDGDTGRVCVLSPAPSPISASRSLPEESSPAIP